MCYVFRQPRGDMVDKFLIEVIGTVRSPIKRLEDCPKQGDEGGRNVRVELDPAYAQGLKGVQPGDRLVLLTWLHQAERKILQVHPRGNKKNPLTGVFFTRSPARPNPIGLHEVKVLDRQDECTLVAGPLEVLDGTPIIDIKKAQ